MSPVVAGVYALLVAILWLPYGLRSGMGYETTLVYASETRSFLDGFLYDADPLRRFTQLFYQTGYQLSNLCGIDGSFDGVQLVYAVLWWARGFLTYLILRRLFPSIALVAYAAGALVLVHASDGALNWVGQLNQFGMIFWLVLTVYLLVVAVQQRGAARASLFAAGAAGASYLCLWSYESPIVIALLAPIAVWLATGRGRRSALVAATFYAVPAVFIVKNVERYAGDGDTYQSSVARDDLGLGQLAGDLLFNVSASVLPWRWGDGIVASDHRSAVLAGIGAAVVFVVGTFLVAWFAGGLPNHRQLCVALAAAGLVLVVASFPAYLALADARALWRTQFLSGIGFGIGAGALAVLLGSTISVPLARVGAVSLLGALVAYLGAWTAYAQAERHYEIWERHRLVVAELLEVAPRVEEDTVVVLTNVPRRPDPFGHNMWFDVALRLAYPRTEVAGIYYLDDGSQAPGLNLAVRADAWVQEPKGFPTLIERAPLSRTLVIRYSGTGRGTILEEIPSFVRGAARLRAVYDPNAAIEPGRRSPLAERRYEVE